MQQERIKMKNRIRTAFKEVFTNRDCVTLVRPVTNEKQLRTLHEQKYSTLRPEFRRGMDQVTVIHYLCMHMHMSIFIFIHITCTHSALTHTRAYIVHTQYTVHTQCTHRHSSSLFCSTKPTASQRPSSCRGYLTLET